MKTKMIILFILAVFSICLLVVVIVGVCNQDVKQTQNARQLPSYKVKGPVKVSYDIHVSDAESFGTGSTPVDAKEVILFDKYVIIKGTDSSTRLLPLAKIKYMS